MFTSIAPLVQKDQGLNTITYGDVLDLPIFL
jgi:hypothetical protein